jgi:hypothetical protein
VPERRGPFPAAKGNDGGTVGAGSACTEGLSVVIDVQDSTLGAAGPSELRRPLDVARGVNYQHERFGVHARHLVGELEGVV